jgi:RimJ/RimL family protein N-acetyltransferase
VIRLERFAERHLGAFAALATDPEIQRFTRFPVPPPPGWTRQWFAGYEQGRADGTREAFAIEDVHDGQFLGAALVPELDREGRSAELGYLVAPAARGRGVATQGLRLLTEWAFTTAGLLRAQLLIATDNEASKRVAVAAGYEREGVMRSVHFKQGLRIDLEIWSRLAA